jgi:hypothetical protein
MMKWQILLMEMLGIGVSMRLFISFLDNLMRNTIQKFSELQFESIILLNLPIFGEKFDIL